MPHQVQMDTPEGEISAIQAGTMEPLPLYQEYDDSQGLEGLIAALSDDISPPYRVSLDESTQDQSKSQSSSLPNTTTPKIPRPVIIKGFYEAISKGQFDAIALFINKNLVTANTLDDEGKTPLLTAVATRNIEIAKQLLDFGAEPDTFGITSRSWNRDPLYNVHTPIKRTPLQLAASEGHLPLVKLLMEVYHCDDSLVAPDGQIALRLASTNGHREVVDYLPSRRGGGFLRWQTQHKRAIYRAKKALKRIGHFIKFFVWDIEKFFLWTVPKHTIVKPVKKGVDWCWKHKSGVIPWCKNQVKQTPERAKKAGKWAWKGVKAVPKKIKEVGKSIWEFLRVELPRFFKWLGKFLWSLFTKRIPQAIAISAKWIWSCITSAGKAIWNVIQRLASLLHTIFAAILSFFKELTLKDIWNGFVDVLKAIFVGFPKTLWGWIENFGEASYKAMKALFGTIGQILWYISLGIGWVVVFLPMKTWNIIKNMGGSFAKGLHEIFVWFRPKA